MLELYFDTLHALQPCESDPEFLALCRHQLPSSPAVFQDAHGINTAHEQSGTIRHVKCHQLILQQGPTTRHDQGGIIIKIERSKD